MSIVIVSIRQIVALWIMRAIFLACSEYRLHVVAWSWMCRRLFFDPFDWGKPFFQGRTSHEECVRYAQPRFTGTTANDCIDLSYEQRSSRSGEPPLSPQRELVYVSLSGKSTFFSCRRYYPHVLKPNHVFSYYSTSWYHILVFSHFLVKNFTIEKTISVPRVYYNETWVTYGKAVCCLGFRRSLAQSSIGGHLCVYKPKLRANQAEKLP